MKHILFIVLLSPVFLFAQSFPTDAKVISDVKTYHGKIATASVQNDWKLEKEPGYQFANMAKRVVAATTVKENGVSKKIIGLAIYVRGSGGEAWKFSRYFVTGSEVVGTKTLTSEDLKQQTLDLIRKEPIKVFVDFKNISWVYDITFPDVSQNRTDRTGDVIYNGFIEYDKKWNDSEDITLPNYPFEAGVRKYKAPVEAYVRLVDGQMKVAVVSIGYDDSPVKKMLSRKTFESLPSLANTSIDQLFGPVCPYLNADTGKEGKSSEPSSSSPEKKTKKIGLPKIKIQ